MDTFKNASICCNDNLSIYTVANDENFTATTPLITSLGISLTGYQSVIYYIAGLFGVVSNSYVIIVIVLNKSMYRHLTNIYIINQSIIDGLASAILILQTVFQNNAIANQYTPGNIADETLCRLWYSVFPLWGLMDSSTYNIVALTFERYLAIVHPIWYKTKFSSNRFMIGLSIASVWFIGIAYNAAYLIPSSSISSSGLCTEYIYPGLWAKFLVGILTFVFELLIPFLLMAFGYSVIAWSIHKRTKISPQQKYDDNHGNPKTEAVANESMVKARLNVLQTSALIGLFFVICWSPNELFFLAYNLNAPCCQDLQSAFDIITTAMIPFNCCANPIIYSLTYREFKRGAARLFTRMKRSRRVAETTSFSVRTEH